MFGQKAAKIKKLEEQIVDLKLTIENDRECNAKQRAEWEAQQAKDRSELNRLRQRDKTITEGELMLVSTQIISKLLAGEKVSSQGISALQQQQEALRTAVNLWNCTQLGGILGGLGNMTPWR